MISPGETACDRRDRGFVLVWFALVLVVLLSFAAFAVDIAHWYKVQSAEQKAADAAALAGVVFMPENSGDEAFDTAAQVAARNGFTDGVDGTTVTLSPGARPNQLRVEISRTVDNVFARIMGIDTTDVGAVAVAEYDRPVAMGSPSNTFGNQPDCVGTCSNGDPTPDFWLNVAGPQSYKVKGDARQAALCSGGEDGCSGTNSDYAPGGYEYIIRNQNGGGNLTIDVFDPGFVAVGDLCGDRAPGQRRGPYDDGSGLENLWNETGDDRYEPGGASPYCTGDKLFDEGNGVPPWTSYQVFWTNGTPWTTDDDVEVTACRADFPGFTGDLYARWLAEQVDPGLEPLVTQYFRRWVGICTISGGDLHEGDYRLRIRTNAAADGSAVPQGGGHNRAAIRVAKGGDLATSDVSVFGDARMAVYANATGASTEFYLARVLPGAAGRELILRFYDTGDADDAGTLTVLPPADSGLSSFSGCLYTPPPEDEALEPTGPGCAVGGVSKDDHWDGQWVRWVVPIPDDYTCDVADAGGCWVRLRFTYPAGTDVNDTTTWSARLGGDPVRLVE